MDAVETLLQPVFRFLSCRTPDAWLRQATEDLSLLLIDHANCELKAAQSAVRLLRHYSDDDTDWLTALKPYEALAFGRCSMVEFETAVGQQRLPSPNTRSPMVDKLHLLIREELHHFRQVVALMAQRQIPYRHLPAGGYAARLRQHCRHHEPARQIDLCIVGALIEARSCERFAALVPNVDETLACFYRSLLRSEARHFEDYLALANAIDPAQVSQRVAELVQVEGELILAGEASVRFHSGVPMT
ncbi:tRNA-(ms[2]io[6]A)-hydroxylase [Ferrimonas gelatinilytica]|uniref:tRNA isopentenyl-2-thiomethyl-A-37 hydroxylase MiaE n=1 Tax=Ferrimonas gelatinilytica TaxID=1255257 RepID=A0ABP9S511_9GAMM